MMILYLILLMLLGGVPLFLFALLIQRYLIKPRQGETRIFLALAMALPVVARLWSLFAWAVNGVL